MALERITGSITDARTASHAREERNGEEDQGGQGAAGTAVAGATPYVQRLIQDEELRDNLRTAYESGRSAYGRLNNGKAPAKALLDDKKLHKDLQNAADALRDASDALREGPKKKKRKGGLGRLLLLAHHRRRRRPRRERGPAQQGARPAVRRRGGVRLHVDHRAVEPRPEPAGSDRHASAGPTPVVGGGRPRAPSVVPRPAG